MFVNQKFCTVYEKITGGNRMENKQGQFTLDRSMKQSDYILCMIPVASLTDYIPKPDDRLVYGACDSEEPPETGIYTITDVKNFLYGSPGVRHIEVTAI